MLAGHKVELVAYYVPLPSFRVSLALSLRVYCTCTVICRPILHPNPLWTGTVGQDAQISCQSLPSLSRERESSWCRCSGRLANLSLQLCASTYHLPSFSCVRASQHHESEQSQGRKGACPVYHLYCMYVSSCSTLFCSTHHPFQASSLRPPYFAVTPPALPPRAPRHCSRC